MRTSLHKKISHSGRKRARRCAQEAGCCGATRGESKLLVRGRSMLSKVCRTCIAVSEVFLLVDVSPFLCRVQAAHSSMAQSACAQRRRFAGDSSVHPSHHSLSDPQATLRACVMCFYQPTKSADFLPRLIRLLRAASSDARSAAEARATNRRRAIPTSTPWMLLNSVQS